VALAVYYKYMHLIIQFDPGAAQLFLNTSFLSLLFGDACCHQQHKCLVVAHKQQHFQAPIREFI
jgi:hypothetical protein